MKNVNDYKALATEFILENDGIAPLEELGTEWASDVCTYHKDAVEAFMALYHDGDLDVDALNSIKDVVDLDDVDSISSLVVTIAISGLSLIYDQALSELGD